MIDNNTLISFSNPKSTVAEAYRVLRTNIQFTGLDKPVKTIMVTSSAPGEGKTTVISNLAVVIAQSGSKVLLVDADLRKPRVHAYFGVDMKKGMTSLLTQHGDIKNYIQNVGINGLDILASGPIPPNPSELIGSNVMKKFIEAVSPNYDMVLFDSPPINLVTDAAVLSTACDGVIFVCSSGKANIDEVKKAKELLKKVKANVLGVVLNRLDRDYQRKYYYYYENDNKKKKKSK